MQAAKALAWSRGLPLAGVHHLAGHLEAIRLGENPPEPPYIGLVVSGGHTSLYTVEEGQRYRLIGRTYDDAAGEAFDKVAKMLGLPYPGGVQIDRLAVKGNRTAIDFPRGLSKRDTLDFSFSGLKTSVLTHLKLHGLPEGQALADLCASFQESVADVLSARAVLAARRFGIGALVLCGGVAANSRLRALTRERGQAAGLTVHLPEPKLCTDNGAMIAAAGTLRLQRGELAPLTLNADAALPLI